MNLPVKIRRDWHYYAFAIGLIFILNGVVGLLGFEAKGWQTYAVGLVTWVISFWLAGLIIRRRDEETENANKNIIGRKILHCGFQCVIRSVTLQRQLNQTCDQIGVTQTAGLPQLRIHTDVGEARQCVELVDHHFVLWG